MSDTDDSTPASNPQRRKLLKASALALAGAGLTAPRRSSARGSRTTPGRRPRRRSRW